VFKYACAFRDIPVSLIEKGGRCSGSNTIFNALKLGRTTIYRWWPKSLQAIAAAAGFRDGTKYRMLSSPCWLIRSESRENKDRVTRYSFINLNSKSNSNSNLFPWFFHLNQFNMCRTQTLSAYTVASCTKRPLLRRSRAIRLVFKFLEESQANKLCSSLNERRNALSVSLSWPFNMEDYNSRDRFAPFKHITNSQSHVSIPNKDTRKVMEKLKALNDIIMY
jgi:hypothetical protein